MGQGTQWLVDTRGQVGPGEVSEAFQEMAGGQCAVEAIEGRHPERDTYGPMVLVRGTQAQRPVVEQWLAGSNTIL
eukprot:12069823-Alexandrium_andersonii.AAC.1